MPTFAVLAHTDPAMLARLVAALAPDPVFVHVDRRSRRGDFEAALAPLAHVHLLPEAASYRIHWAAWSSVQASAALARAALTTTAAGDHLVFLSGQDYPLRPLAEFRAYLRDAPWRQHVRLVDARSRANEFELHFVDRHFQDVVVLPHVPRWSQRDRANLGTRTVLRTAARHLPHVVAPAGLRLAFGSNWVALTPDCVEYLVGAMTPEVVRYFRRVWAPDERCWHSLLADSPYLAQTPAGELESWDPSSWPANFHHIDPSLSRYYDVTDDAELAASGQYFVRKVTSTGGVSLLDAIDERIGGRRADTAPAGSGKGDPE